MRLLEPFSLLMLALLMPVCPIFAQTDTDQLITEVQVTDTDSTYRYLYYYNDNKLKTLETKYVLKGDEWARRNQTEWLYSSGLCTLQRMNRWNNNNWETFYHIIYEYSDGNLIKETHQNVVNGNTTLISKSECSYNQHLLTNKTDYNRSGDYWIKTLNTDYIYNDKDLTEQITIYRYSSGFLPGESKINFSYNDSAKLINLLFSEKTDTGWVNVTKCETFYLPDGKIKSSEIQKLWDKTGNKWEYNQNIRYTYDTARRLTGELYQYWKNIYWENVLQYRYEYNSDGAVLRKTAFLPVYDDFRAVSSINYSDFKYSRASLIKSGLEFWGGDAGTVISTFIPFQFNKETVIRKAGQIKISYIPVSDTGISITRNNLSGEIRVYPNPSKGIFYFDSQQVDVSQWIVTDLSGKTLIRKSQPERSGVIDLGDFNQGIYLLHVVTPQGVCVQKLIRE
ncbi:MAG: hypothetical protein H6Q19_643 [Bacteroidetes bacterium]|nr:hypothetical protein [Bacteroidota bacterium]